MGGHGTVRRIVIYDIYYFTIKFNLPTRINNYAK